MTEAEKADCLLRARQGFDQGAQLLMLGGPRTEERFLLRVLGAKRARSQGPWQLGSWRFWSCLAGQNRREFLKCFLNRDGSSNQKRLVILFASSGRGGRLRAMQVWRRACAGDEALMGEIPVLLIQTSRSKRSGLRGFRRQENSEWRLQQAAAACLGRQVPVFTVTASGRERLWYQLIKNLNE